MSELWSAEEAQAATGGRLINGESWSVNGVSIDTRSLEPGDFFVALKDVRDGHDFLAQAFVSGASAALISDARKVEGLGAALAVPDVLEGLRKLGEAARDRCAAKRVAVTGSVGKTSTKEALAICLAASGPTHRSVKSYNNHWGVPLTLSRMPRESQFAVFEIGMNHRGEILPLTKLVKPHAALVTTIAPAHVENLGSLEAVADEKGDIYAGLEPGGSAIVPNEAPHSDRLVAAAERNGANLVRFGRDAVCEARLLRWEMDASGSNAEAEILGRTIKYRVGVEGAHWALNSVAALAAADVVGADLEAAAHALEHLRAFDGRGVAQQVAAPFGPFMLVDDSYNANPASMAAAIATLSARQPGAGGRRIAAFGDMLELGPDERAYHAGLAQPLEQAGIDLVFAAGPRMAALMETLPASRRGGYAETSDALIPIIASSLRSGDIVLVKGSNGSKMSRVVAALQQLSGIRMLELLTQYSDSSQFFNLFNYITFRTGGAMFTAMILAFAIGAPFIAWLRKKQGKGQPIREDGPQGHLLTKKGTPTMGGLIILISLGISSLLWADLKNPYVWSVLVVTIGFGAIGFVDDFAKVTKQHHGGLSAKLRLLFEFSIAAVAAIAMLSAEWIATTPDQAHTIMGFWNALWGADPLTAVALPFIQGWGVQLLAFYAIFAMIVIVGFGNAVNLTDGLDGLAIVPVMIAASTFGVICYLVGRVDYSQYLGIPHVAGVGELATILGALLGASLGFLWYNAPPARVFMGDTGSLALGGLLGSVAVATKHEIVLVIVGGLFVLETLSVMVQVAVFKRTGKRLFLMAPIHHHFEKLGWQEPTIVIRFWIISVIFALAGLATLKLR